MSAAGIQTLIIQWSVADGQHLYKDGSTLPRLMDELARAGVQFHVGLELDPKIFSTASLSSAELQAYLASRLRRTSSFLPELAPIVASQPGFRGWYITDEVDDGHWLIKQRQRHLAQYLRSLQRELRDITPLASVSVSGYSSSRGKSAAVARFWKRLLKSSKIDLIFYQTGLGVTAKSHEEVRGELRRLAKALPGQVSPVIEAFKQTTENGTFSASPASVAEYLAQVRISDEKGLSTPVIFSVPEYMIPEFATPEHRTGASALLAAQAALVARCTPS